jgi:glycosyltransferase involved in cell wall biosynthesis
VPCEDASTLADRLFEITKNPARLGEVGTRARQRVLESYTIEKTAERAANIYYAVLAHKSGN